LATLQPREVKLKKDLPEFQRELTRQRLLNKPVKFANVEMLGGVDELLWIEKNISRVGKEADWLFLELVS
jgi:hypothetical protein